MLEITPLLPLVYPYLGLDEHEVDKNDHKIVFDIFIGEPLAARTLGQSDTLALRAVIRTTVGAVQVRDRIRAFNADWHRFMAPLRELERSRSKGNSKRCCRPRRLTVMEI